MQRCFVTKKGNWLPVESRYSQMSGPCTEHLLGKLLPELTKMTVNIVQLKYCQFCGDLTALVCLFGLNSFLSF